MRSIDYTYKKIHDFYVVWLQKSNKYIQLEEPAWFVFSKLANRYKTETIAARCAVRYGLEADESLAFVDEIRSGIERLNQPINNQGRAINISSEESRPSVPYSRRRYRFEDKLIEFSYETRLFEYYLHPLICHLETTEVQDDVPVFELFRCDDKIIFRLNGTTKGSWDNDETHLMKGQIFMNLLSVMFGKNDLDWLMTVHASALTNGRKTLLISAGPGSGKTTMAALLQNRGYQMVSDDFVAIDRYSIHAWPFPLAMSVKQGAMELLSSLYPDLEQQPLTHISPEKKVRYLYPEINQESVKRTFPVKEFIFIQYNKTVDFEWEKLDQRNAVKLLFDQSWISPADGIAPVLLNQLDRWSFYRLTYSDNQKALDAITNLFNHD